MPAAVGRLPIQASNMYFLTLLLCNVTGMVQVASTFVTNWPAVWDWKGMTLVGIIATVLLLMLSLLVRIGIGNRAGKCWAYLLFVAYALWTGY